MKTFAILVCAALSFAGCDTKSRQAGPYVPAFVTQDMVPAPKPCTPRRVAQLFDSDNFHVFSHGEISRRPLFQVPADSADRRAFTCYIRHNGDDWYFPADRYILRFTTVCE